MSISGTNLGIQSADVLSVTIGDSTCDIDYDRYTPGKMFVVCLFVCLYTCLFVCLLIELCVGQEAIYLTPLR